MTLSRIVLQMARNPGTAFAEGDDRRGYVIVAPLDADDRLDSHAFAEARDRCRVRHFADGEAPKEGRLSRRGQNWFIHYDADAGADGAAEGTVEGDGGDEAGFHLGDHRFRPGDYVTFRDTHDQAWTYRVADVKPA